MVDNRGLWQLWLECTMMHECQSNRMWARDQRLKLLIWRQRYGEHAKVLSRFERDFRRRFGPESLAAGDTTDARIEALEAALETYLTG